MQASKLFLRMLAVEDKKLKGKAKGGIARAKSLTADEKKDIAKKGASARWDTSTEIAKRSGSIEIGDISIPCAVLEDGTRVLSERAITKAFGGKRGGSPRSTASVSRLSGSELYELRKL